MSFDDAMEATVTRDEARAEIRRHLAGRPMDEVWNEFVQDIGDRQEYLGADVLGWLGY